MRVKTPPRSCRRSRAPLAPALAVALATLLGTAPASARPFGPERPDLHAHFWLSFGVALVLTEVLEGPDPQWGPQLGTGWATLIATGAVAALGLAKELTDPKFSGDDLAADIGGLTAHMLVQITLDF